MGICFYNLPRVNAPERTRKGVTPLTLFRVGRASPQKHLAIPKAVPNCNCNLYVRYVSNLQPGCLSLQRLTSTYDRRVIPSDLGRSA